MIGWLLAGLAVAGDPPTAEDLYTIVDVVANNPHYSRLVGAIEATGLATTLSEEGPFTLFAPGDDAFAVSEDLGDVDLSTLVRRHVVVGRLSVDQVAKGRVRTMAGDELKLRVRRDGTVLVDGARITVSDVVADNGVVHAIDRVLVP